MADRWLWDIFCKVVDNHGDLGVSWRLSHNLTQRGQRVRLWVDDPSALTWMAPQADPGIELRHWTTPLARKPLPAGDVLVETFGCDIAPEFMAMFQDWQRQAPAYLPWINLEYLSAQDYVERSHRLPSPVRHGPGAGLTRHFFYPGFTARTGGLLREPDLPRRQSSFERDAWLARLGLPPGAARRISLFCYEPHALQTLLAELQACPTPTQLLVTAGRTTRAVRCALEGQASRKPNIHKESLLSISYLPLLSQDDYDHLLWSCDLNFVRGEDSLVRALWAGQPLVWQLYPQEDGAHAPKLEAFLERLQAPEPMRHFMRAWNGLAKPAALGSTSGWQEAVRSLRQQLAGQPDLSDQLLAFAGQLKHKGADENH